MYFDKLCTVNGVQTCNWGTFDRDITRVNQFGQELYNLYTTTPQQPPFGKPFIDYQQLKNNIKSIDFDSLITTLATLKSIPLHEIKNRLFIYNAGPFSDTTGKLDLLLQKYGIETITNYIILSSFEDVMAKFDIVLDPQVGCENAVVHALPLPSLRVFVRNYFKKENIKSVSDLVEDTKKSFKKMIEASDWVNAETKKAAVKKVQEMKKVIGYPEEMEVSGALDKTFDIRIHAQSSWFEIMSLIEGRSVLQLFGYIFEGTPLNPMTVGFEPNANYVPLGNTLTVMVPLMDEPLFDHTFPSYAKIASLGFVLSHEMGHGFDPTGIQFDENGNFRQWYTPSDILSYGMKSQCFVKQYDAYDDPSFGKKLKGVNTLNEMIADEIGADVSWRTFKNSDSASEPRIIGFEDYDVNKLYFQIVAMNWCSPRSTLSLEQQLTLTHPTNSFRINGVFSNMKSFAETFNCPVGSPMNPEKKCELF